MIRIAVVMVCLLTLNGCAVFIPAMNSESKLDDIKIGMSEEEIEYELGQPDRNESSIKLWNGSIQTIKKYDLYDRRTARTNFLMGFPMVTMSWWFLWDWPRSYALKFIDGKLEEWSYN